MNNTNTTIELKLPVTNIKENSVKVIGLLLSIMEVEQLNSLNVAYKIIIRYNSNDIIAIDNSIDVKLLKSLLYYLKVTNNTIVEVSKEYENGDFIRIKLLEDYYSILIAEKYSKLMDKKIKLLESCAITEEDTIDCIGLEDINKNSLISTLSKKIRVKDCINIVINGVTVNIIKSIDIILIIDIDNIYIVDFYSDFKATKDGLKRDIEALVNTDDSGIKNKKIEYCFV